MNRILAVSEDSGFVSGLFSEPLSAEWEHRRWHAFTTEDLRHSSADLVLLVGLPEPFRVLDLLHKLEGRSLAQPADCGAATRSQTAELGQVSAAADDFILWPERAEVVRLRIARFILPAAELQSAYENVAVVGLAKANLVGRDPSLSPHGRQGGTERQ